MSGQVPSSILVTGAAGFVGRAAVTAFAAEWQTAAFTLVDINSSDQALSANIVSYVGDVTDPEVIGPLLRHAQPATVLHLAAHSFVGSADNNARAVWQTNLMGTLQVVEAILEHSPSSHLVFASTAAVYGDSALGDRAVTEDTVLLPNNTYSASKAAADMLILAARSRGLSATIVRATNHTGPGQDSRFVVPSFCRQIAEIEQGLLPPIIKVGELDDMREFLDIRDVVDLYRRIILADPEVSGGLLINASSGASRRIRDVLKMLLSFAETKITIEIDASLVRSSRSPSIRCSADRAGRALGWRAETPFETTLARTLSFWRAHVRRQRP